MIEPTMTITQHTSRPRLAQTLHVFTMCSLTFLLMLICSSSVHAFVATGHHGFHRGSTTSNTVLSATSKNTPPPPSLSMEERIKNGSNNSNRGDGRYGASNNSTIPTNVESAAIVGVVPPMDAPAATWKRAWKTFGKALPLLHLFDNYQPPDSKLALHCLWWKALSANDRNSPVHDDSLAYDLLPRGTRVVVGKKLRRLFPRLHHANVEIRTAYLDRAVIQQVESIRINNRDGTTKIRLISLGAGYDVRSIKFRERGAIDEAIEIDLPQVIEAKTKILQSKRFQRRRPLLHQDLLPKFYPANLNELDQVETILLEILRGGGGVVEASSSSSSTTTSRWHTIFLFEGVMIYLDKDIPAGLLERTSKVLHDTNQEGSLIFADRLDNIPGGDIDIGKEELARHGWEIVDWLPKPGLARHMGRARLIKNKQ